MIFVNWVVFVKWEFATTGVVFAKWEVWARKEALGVLTVHSRSRERIDYQVVIKRNECATVLSQSVEPAEKPKEEPKDHPK